MSPSIPVATRPTLEETKEAGNMQSLLFPSPGEKSKEKLTPLELGVAGGHERVGRKLQQRAGRTKALPWSALHDRQPAQGKTHCSVYVQLCLLDWETKPRVELYPHPRVFWDCLTTYSSSWPQILNLPASASQYYKHTPARLVYSFWKEIINW